MSMNSEDDVPACEKNNQLPDIKSTGRATRMLKETLVEQDKQYRRRMKKYHQ